jgi:hypothetical protein
LTIARLRLELQQASAWPFSPFCPALLHKVRQALAARWREYTTFLRASWGRCSRNRSGHFRSRYFRRIETFERHNRTTDPVSLAFQLTNNCLQIQNSSPLTGHIVTYQDCVRIVWSF